MKAAINREERFVIIEDVDTGSFIQFAVLNEKEKILMDVPLVELSDNQIDDTKKILNVEVAVDSHTGEEISIQKLFYCDELRKVSKLTEKILAQVFNLPEDFDILIEVFS